MIPSDAGEGSNVLLNDEIASPRYSGARNDNKGIFQRELIRENVSSV